MSYWEKLTDEELTKRMWEEKKKLRYAREQRDKKIARSNIDAIFKEQTKRYEKSFGLS